MNPYIDHITIQVTLSTHGDALIHGTAQQLGSLNGQQLKDRLFAWHEASFYGTALEIKQVQDIDLILLPAEQVLPFWADPQLLQHMEWSWAEEASMLAQAAPVLMKCIDAKRYLPSFVDFRATGRLVWTWDEAGLEPHELNLLLEASEIDEFRQGLSAAFSACVYDRWYGTEEAAADLRREYPQLFSRAGIPAAGLDAQSWLVAIGWRTDLAPFRPALQLLEPEEEHDSWRLNLVLQDKLDPAALYPVQLNEGGQALGAWPEAWNGHAAERSASWLERLRSVLPGAWLTGSPDDLLSRPLGSEGAWQFLTQHSLRLLEAGWQVLLPAWWEAARRKKPRLKAKVKPEEGDSQAQGSRGSSLFGLDSIISFDWRISIGESDLTEGEFEELVARGERLVRFRDQWVPLDPALLAQIHRAMNGVDKEQGLSFQDILHLHLTQDRQDQRGKTEAQAEAEEPEQSPDAPVRLEVELNEHLTKLIAQLGRHSELPLLPQPAGLRAELRSYQREGFSWLSLMRRFGLGACLADDMGLGKTVQFIAYLLQLQESREAAQASSLLVCPTSVLGNWQKELARFAPSLRIMIHYGPSRLSGEAFQEAVKQADIVLTSYATATLDQELLCTVTWASICLDEAQNIKNAQTKQSAAVKSFPARHRIALTGTPIENRLTELWSLYDFMNPGYLGSARVFQHRFIQPIEKDGNGDRTKELQKLVHPFMLRRKKKDPAIQLDLPDKNEAKIYIPLTPEQSALYEQTVHALMERMKQLEGIARKGAILSALTQLKQLCDHPVLLTQEALPLSAEDGWDPEDRKRSVSRSAKLERLLDMVKELREEGDRCLIFTQYVGMGLLLQQVLQQELQEPVLYLNGSTPKTARDKMIDKFQSRSLPPEEQPNVFILSIKAGGVGLNLTAANHVFHFDRWWNPAVENQATDRAYRMGQTKDVQVHKFIALGTLEERIDEMLESKQQLSDNVISSTEGWITELSTEELKDLFTLRQGIGG
ncbi:ATP-dependent helicase [Paenibacillus sp. CAA11]|uniref:DEAD/DEAH box helicase n=1 Tax=Paenibacillus sp. CAA11 TaxID=1532905 RepID=UPI000D3AA277|nr:DEAD/DEAH box helicase [Paenibacillus sp. CAA11]AWB46741.1 ATP-dependent helicase [Paenibacillus sp. CAA11]